MAALALFDFLMAGFRQRLAEGNTARESGATQGTHVVRPARCVRCGHLEDEPAGYAVGSACGVCGGAMNGVKEGA